jgi:hypothetical protein
MKKLPQSKQKRFGAAGCGISLTANIKTFRARKPLGLVRKNAS